MGGAQLFGLCGRVERVGEEQQMVGQGAVFGGGDGGLAASIRMTGEDDSVGSLLAQEGDGLDEAIAVFFGFAWMRRAGAAALAEREVAAEDVEAMLGELFGDGDEQGSGAIGSSAVG